MSDALALPDGWTPVASPPSLFRRYEFGSYAQTRAFLDRLAQLSQETSIYPDLGFGRTYVNVTLRTAAAHAPSPEEVQFAARAVGAAQS